MATAVAETETFKCDFFFTSLVSGLKNLRESNQLKDVILKVEGREFSCHKLILAANSRYFATIFTAHVTERKSKVISMPPEIGAVAMDTLLNYFYSGELVLSQKNVESVFIATDYMRLDPLLEICIEKMETTLNPSNCIRRYFMADPIQYSSPRLDSFRKAAAGLIIGEEVMASGTAEFLGLSAKLITKIFQLNTQSERAELLYAAILKWVGHDEESRQQFLYDLLVLLPVDGISDEFFASKIRNEDLLRRDQRSVLWLFDNFTLRQSTRPTILTQPNSLFITGHRSDRKCYQLKLQDPRPLEVSDRPEISYFSAVCHQKRISLLCGRGTENAYQLDGPQQKWMTSDLDLSFGRALAGCVVLADDLFVLGGLDLRSTYTLSSSMKFCFSSGRKEYLPDMNEARRQPGTATYANSVYVACGSSVSPSIERYDPREGQWCTVGGYTAEIESCSSATIGDYLYSCDVDSGSIERFDFRANLSQRICSFVPGSGFDGRSIASVEGRLLGATWQSVLEYDRVADKWNYVCKLGVEFPILVPWRY